MKARLIKVVFVAFVGIALILCGWQLWQYDRAIEQWQAEVTRLNAELDRIEPLIEEAQLQAESDYYRGVLSSCVGIGMKMSVPRAQLALTCSAYMNSAYEADWYDELQIDTWQWPPKKE